VRVRHITRLPRRLLFRLVPSGCDPAERALFQARLLHFRNGDSACIRNRTRRRSNSNACICLRAWKGGRFHAHSRGPIHPPIERKAALWPTQATDPSRRSFGWLRAVAELHVPDFEIAHRRVMRIGTGQDDLHVRANLCLGANLRIVLIVSGYGIDELVSEELVAVWV